MQAYDAWAVQVARDTQYPTGYRYLVQRLAELLDARAGLVVSGAALSSPAVLLRETQDVLVAHLADQQNPAASLASAHCAVTLATLEKDSRLAHWYATAHNEACDRLRAVVAARAAPGPPPHGTKLGVWRKAEFLAAIRQAVRGPLQTLRAALSGEGATSYLERLAAEVATVASTEQFSTREWLSFDADLQRLAAELLARGRDGRRTAQSIGATIRNSHELRNLGPRLKSQLLQDRREFKVAFVVDGLSHPRRTESHGCSVLDDPARWPNATATDPSLIDFVRGAAGKRAAVFATEVRAYDYADAVVRARAKAQELVDQLVAEARVGWFRVHDFYLVRDSGRTRRHTKLVGPEGPYASQLKPRFASANDRFARSLRYGAIGRHESSSVVGVLHHWIALESLGEGGAGFVSEHLPPLLGLHAVRQDLATAWRNFRREFNLRDDDERARAFRELAAWLGVGHGYRLNDMNRWVDLLGQGAGDQRRPVTLAPADHVEVAARQLAYLKPSLTPFVSQHLSRWSLRLRDGGALHAFLASTTETWAATTLRMRLLRNGTVHVGVTESAGSAQLRQAASDALDAVHEVLPLWADAFPGEPSAALFARVKDRRELVAAEWARSAAPPRIDAERLTLPVGDGLTRAT